jgi:hypothetical protein
VQGKPDGDAHGTGSATHGKNGVHPPDISQTERRARGVVVSARRGLPVHRAGGAPQFFSNAVIGSNNGIGDGFFGLPTVISPVNGQSVLPTPGNLGRNTFTGPSWSNLDFSIIKDTQITESKMLQFRAEFFNIFNQATFGTPGEILGSSGFGISTGTATAERQIQFGLRLIF